MSVPDYAGGSIVNLMASVITARGGKTFGYPVLKGLDTRDLRGARNLILIVIDGLGYKYLLNAGPGRTLRQHLKGKITSVFPTTTATAITTFLTGIAPQQHGITGWFTYFKEIDRVTAVLPFRAREGNVALTRSGIDAATPRRHSPKVRCSMERSSARVTEPSSISEPGFPAPFPPPRPCPCTP